MSYGKLFESTYTGSMVGKGVAVFALWPYVIAHTKPPGVVEINPVLVAAVIGCPVDDVINAISLLTSPDPESRSKDEGGCRLVKIGQFLYRVPSWAHYRDVRNDDERKAYNRDAQQKSRRARRQKESMTVNDTSMTVIDSQSLSAMSAQAEAEAEASSPPLNPPGGHAQALRVLNQLSKSAGKSFRPVEANLKPIRLRLGEPDVTEDGIMAMIARQARRWIGTPFEEYLRPETLFRKSKFDGYYAARNAPLPPTSAKPEQNGAADRNRYIIP